MSNTMEGSFPSAEYAKQALVNASPGDAVRLADAHLRSGLVALALRVCESARELGLNDVALTLIEAAARFRRKDLQGALAAVDEVLQKNPRNLHALYAKAQMLAETGNCGASCALLKIIVDCYPDFPGAHGALAALLMPGPPYRDVLRELHEQIRPRTYLEIGVEDGATLALADAAGLAVGVDPNLSRLQVGLPGNVVTYALTSDQFFSMYRREEIFGERGVDLVFVDGLHEYTQVLRDVAHAERWASPSSTIVLHDALPVSAVAARRERASYIWVGDVWKALEAVLDYRPDLQVTTILTPPSGLVLLRGLNPHSTLLLDKLDEIAAAYREREYPYPLGSWPSRYRTISSSADEIEKALRLD